MTNFTSTLVSGQAAGSVWDGADDITQVWQRPEAITQVMAAAPANANLPAAGAIPGRSDLGFLAQGMRGNPAGDAQYEAIKDISDGIQAEKAAPAYLASEKRMADMMGLKNKGPTGRAWFEQQYGGAKSALSAEEEVASSLGGEAALLGEAGEVGEEVGAMSKIGALVNNPWLGGGLAGLNVLGGAADVVTGVSEVMDGKVGYGIADTAIGMGNMAVGSATLAELAMTGVATTSPIGLALGAAALGVKGDKFMQETGILDGVFGRDDEGESYGLAGGIGSVISKAAGGDTTAILETLGGVAAAPLLVPALASMEVGAGVASLVSSGIDLVGGVWDHLAE